MEAALEGILFAAGDPVGVERLCLTLEADRKTVDTVCQRLADYYSYERRGIRLLKMDTSYQLTSAPEHADLVRKAFERRKPPKLSQPALEVLAIMAYFQPTTRAYVDQVRGVDSSYTIGLLLERELIEEAGRLAVPGRPILFQTTKTFLRTFCLDSLEDLPELPSATAEGGQFTLDMQNTLEKMQIAAEQQWEIPVEDISYQEASALKEGSGENT
jgi:segregation and condensation protein B